MLCNYAETLEEVETETIRPTPSISVDQDRLSQSTADDMQKSVQWPASSSPAVVKQSTTLLLLVYCDSTTLLLLVLLLVY